MKKRKILSLCLAVLLLAMTGCGNRGEGANLDIPFGNTEAPQAEESPAESNPNIVENVKGRFLESDVEMPEMVDLVRAMEKLEDGRIAFFDSYSGLYISEDNGETFSMKDVAVMDEILKNGYYVPRVAIGKDGSLLIQCWQEDGNECIYVDKDGNEVSRYKEDNYIFAYSFLSDGRLVCGCDGVYEINPENGSMTKLCDSKFTVQYIKQIGDYLYFAGDSGIECYNLATKSFEKDDVLEQFIKGDLNFDNADSHSFLMCEGDTEDALYILSQQGLFRHVIKGSVMEEVIKGSLGSMGSPAYYLCGMAFVDKENMLICYNGNQMKAYKYNPDISAIPEHELSVYSLRENAALRVAINLYQQANPDTYLSYEVGMTGMDGITKEDAIRNLNTALLSGEGPDILVLDGLPVESYIEKGILMDLSADISAEYPAGSLYENITNSYKNDKGVCAVPTFFAFHLCAGEDVSGIDNLTGLADKVEALRRENPKGSITGSYLEKEIVTRLYDISSPGFIKEDGSIDREGLTEYLTQAKRIWDVESEDLNTERAKQMAERWDSGSEIMGRDDWCGCIGMYDMRYMSGECRILFGEEESLAWGYTDIVSVFKTLNQNMDIRVLSGFSGNVFIPRTVMGVNASGSQKEAAADFVMSMLSENVQTEATQGGFPVNREAVAKQLAEQEPGVTYGWIGTSDEDGNVIDLEIKWLDKGEQEQFLAMIESLDTPAKLDENVKDTVILIGTEVLKGRMSVDEGVNQIINKVQISLEE